MLIFVFPLAPNDSYFIRVWHDVVYFCWKWRYTPTNQTNPVTCRCLWGVFQSVHGCTDVLTRGYRQASQRSPHIDVVSRPAAGRSETAAEVWCSVHDGHPGRSLVESNTFILSCIAQFAITINSNVCPHIRVSNMLMRNPMHDVIGIFISEARY